MDTYTELSKIMPPVPSVCRTSIRYEYSTRYFYFVSTCQAFLLWIQLDWTKSKVTFGDLSFLQIHSNIIKNDFKVGDTMRDFKPNDSNQNIERLSRMELNWKKYLITFLYCTFAYIYLFLTVFFTDTKAIPCLLEVPGFLISFYYKMKYLTQVPQPLKKSSPFLFFLDIFFFYWIDSLA